MHIIIIIYYAYLYIDVIIQVSNDKHFIQSLTLIYRSHFISFSFNFAFDCCAITKNQFAVNLWKISFAPEAIARHMSITDGTNWTSWILIIQMFWLFRFVFISFILIIQCINDIIRHFDSVHTSYLFSQFSCCSKE